MEDRIIGCNFSAWATANDSVFTPYFWSCLNFAEEYEDLLWDVEKIEIEEWDVEEYEIYFVSGQAVEVIEIEECDEEEEIHYMSQISIVKDSKNVYCVKYDTI